MNPQKPSKFIIGIFSLGLTTLLFNPPANAGYSKCRNNPDPNISPYCFKRGDRGSLIKKVSEHLEEIGYFKGNSTDKFDSKLQKSVINFQKDYRLKASDGIIGNETLLQICKVRVRGCKPNDSRMCYAGSPRMVIGCLSDFNSQGED
jgi:hypothetical protein